MPHPSTYVALLRGINVGGKHMLPMKDLAAIFVQAGCSNVRTYIQSGNVLFNAPASVLNKLSWLITERIAARFGFQVPVVIRTTEQLARTIRENPFPDAAAFPRTLYVCFLADVPDPIAIGSLDPDRSPPHAFRVLNGEIYLHLPGDAARTKLTAAYFDAKLSTTCTARNWNTVRKILELMQA
jgi:uncharacterized protein (DUF1697 family)